MPGPTINRWVLGTALLASFLCCSPSRSWAQTSPGYALKAYALSGGGDAAASTNYTLTATLGQASPAGISSSANYINHVGFWCTVSLKKMLFLPLIFKE